MNIRTRRAVSTAAAAALALGALAVSAGSASAAAKLPAGCKTLTIAFFGAQTGDAGNLGVNISQGAKLAVAQYNAKKPKIKVKFKAFDSQGDPAQAGALAQTVIKDPCIVGVVGPAFSGESAVADPIFNRVGLPIITPSATNPALSTNHWKIFHRAVATDAIQGTYAAKYIKTVLKGTKVAVIDDASDYGKGLADIVAAKLGKTVARESIDPKAQDFSSTVAKIKNSGATVVYYGGYYAEAGRLAKQLKDNGVNAKFVSDDGALDPGFVTAAGAAAAGAIVTAPTAPVADIKGGPAYAAAYKKAFGQDSGTYSAEAYDCANFFLAGIKAHKTTRAALQKYVSTATFVGLTKRLKFSSTGEIEGAAIYSYVYKADGSTKGALIK
ncbi:MAG: branched-chain amino acid ABC transporter substrate-binding protein [Candidatus Nanopelagicales bacterium]